MTVNRAANMLASLIIAATVAAVVALADGPTWAWLGLGLVTYLMVLPDRRAAAKKAAEVHSTIVNVPPADPDAARRAAAAISRIHRAPKKGPGA